MSFSQIFKEKYLLFLSVLISMLLQGCINRIDRVIIEGELHGNLKSYIYISRFEGDSLALIDSIRTSSNGYFKIQVDADYPFFVTVGLDKFDAPITLLIQPGEEIKIESNKSNLSDYKVFGSNGSALVHGLSIKLNETKHQIDSLKQVYNSNLESLKIDSIKYVLDSAYKKIVANHRNYTYALIKDNTFSLVSILAAFQSYDSVHPVLDYSKDRKLFRLIDSTLLSVYSSNSMVQSYHAKIQKLDSLHNQSRKRNLMYQIGDVLPNIGYPLVSGENLLISDIWFKYIVVDFQGPWCELCKDNNLQLRSIYKEFAPKGLVVLQVALGVNPDSLKVSVLRDSLMWYNACIPDIYNNKLLDTLKIYSVPSSYISDRFGVVKATNLTGNKLRLKLSELLPN